VAELQTPAPKKRIIQCVLNRGWVAVEPARFVLELGGGRIGMSASFHSMGILIGGPDFGRVASQGVGVGEANQRAGTIN
jgi:hypothetical protein